jgi:hypothetical protein
LPKRLLTEDFDSRSLQLLKDARDLVKRKESDNDRLEKSEQASIGNWGIDTWIIRMW